eukprot:CAMPEP_0197626478 /NCGR_PEP_ID=MMETSP1338-20131121/5426_1 /TAXON_ID=43686 ORGANISM="Pelagodinium beii, Strain RCC1491" /NCGR_SAMPLE_ID=MMETSP1338 /ASSEMBLY_ACC=CAM_ASM_000754 /LENGTH=566 /DNA_ID=CAMNT_0043197019 /DNA_START=53 /DNA_END=1753 /DNA_ORIENTATION=-
MDEQDIRNMLQGEDLSAEQIEFMVAHNKASTDTAADSEIPAVVEESSTRGRPGRHRISGKRQKMSPSELPGPLQSLANLVKVPMSWNGWQQMVAGLERRGEDIGTARTIGAHRAVMRSKFGDRWNELLAGDDGTLGPVSCALPRPLQRIASLVEEPLTWNAWQKKITGFAKQSEDVGNALTSAAYQAVMYSNFGTDWRQVLGQDEETLAQSSKRSRKRGEAGMHLSKGQSVQHRRAVLIANESSQLKGFLDTARAACPSPQNSALQVALSNASKSADLIMSIAQKLDVQLQLSKKPAKKCNVNPASLENLRKWRAEVAEGKAKLSSTAETSQKLVLAKNSPLYKAIKGDPPSDQPSKASSEIADQPDAAQTRRRQRAFDVGTLVQDIIPCASVDWRTLDIRACGESVATFASHGDYTFDYTMVCNIFDSDTATKLRGHMEDARVRADARQAAQAATSSGTDLAETAKAASSASTHAAKSLGMAPDRVAELACEAAFLAASSAAAGSDHVSSVKIGQAVIDAGISAGVSNSKALACARDSVGIRAVSFCCLHGKDDVSASVSRASQM